MIRRAWTDLASGLDWRWLSGVLAFGTLASVALAAAQAPGPIVALVFGSLAAMTVPAIRGFFGPQRVAPPRGERSDALSRAPVDEEADAAHQDERSSGMDVGEVAAIRAQLAELREWADLASSRVAEPSPDRLYVDELLASQTLAGEELAALRAEMVDMMSAIRGELTELRDRITRTPVRRSEVHGPAEQVGAAALTILEGSPETEAIQYFLTQRRTGLLSAFPSGRPYYFHGHHRAIERYDDLLRAELHIDLRQDVGLFPVLRALTHRHTPTIVVIDLGENVMAGSHWIRTRRWVEELRSQAGASVFIVGADGLIRRMGSETEEGLWFGAGPR